MEKPFSCWLNWSVLVAACLIGVGGETAAIASFDPPPGQGMPTSTAGGGTRPAQAACTPTRSIGLTALSPSRYVGLTVQSRPAVWVYLPTTTAQTLELSLFDQNGNGIYQTTLPIADSNQLMRLTFPKNAPALSTSEPYYWTVAIVCDQNHRTDDWVVGGWIRQQLPDQNFQRQLTTASPAQQVQLYAQAGYWYDAVEVLVGLRTSQPHNHDLDFAWNELMGSIGLFQLAQGLSKTNLE